MSDDEFLADVMQQNTYDLTREEFERLVGLARKGLSKPVIEDENGFLKVDKSPAPVPVQEQKT